MNELTEPIKKAFVVHHNADADGRLSGYIACEYYKEQGFEVVPIGWDYHYDPSNLFLLLKEQREGERHIKECYQDVIVITDISLPKSSMEALHYISPSFNDVVWIDHHKSAIEELEVLGFTGIREVGVAACELAWKFFYPNEDIPIAIKLAGQYDVWKKDGEYSWWVKVIPFQFFLKGQDLDIASQRGREMCQWLCDTDENEPDFENWMDLGNKLVEAETERCKKLSFFRTKFEGVDFTVLNGMGSSTVFEFAEKTGQALMCFWFNSNNVVMFRMYHGTDKSLDLSSIAKKWGGGGHKGACGFHVDQDDGTGIISGDFA